MTHLLGAEPRQGGAGGGRLGRDTGLPRGSPALQRLARYMLYDSRPIVAG